MSLPPFPVDDATLDLCWSALHPDPEVFASSGVGEFLQFMSEMAGSDVKAVEEVIDDGSDGGAEIHMMRDPQYHHNDLIAALIDEIRRLRATQVGGGE
jgi:hypothetical protein